MSAQKPLTRRQILQTASVLGISAVSLSIASDADAAESPEKSLSPQSGLVTKQLKPLKYEEIPGLLTKSQVTPHYQAHYGGALKRFVTLDQQLDTLYKGKETLGGDAYALMQKDKINRMNSVLLHELYFDGLTPKPNDPVADIRTALVN